MKRADSEMPEENGSLSLRLDIYATVTGTVRSGLAEGYAISDLVGCQHGTNDTACVQLGKGVSAHQICRACGDEVIFVL